MRCKNCGIELAENNEIGLCQDCIKEEQEKKEAEESKEAVRDATLKLGGLFTGQKFFTSISIINLVGDMRLLGQDLRETGTFLKFQILNLVVVGIDAGINPELAPFIVNHTRLLVQNGNTNMHVLSCH